MPRLLLAAAACWCVAMAQDEVDCKSMRVKQLRTFLADRGVKCEGCAEKADFLSLCEQHKDTPVLPPAEPEATPAPPQDDKNVDDILKNLKGVPGMEGIKMFSGDDLKNMNFEQMGNMFGGGKPKKRTRSQYRRQLVEFYERYGLTDKLDGVDAALDKWKGREEKMFDALHKKYDAEIKEYWDKEDAKYATPKDGESKAGADEGSADKEEV